ncbi:ABC transporter permease [Aurantimonas sp. C2-6-R+9]|uniref:ABC transporter permease n=1 Tax=unclassified Aurantimonas TaxID=2638230 RepID=UPI002E17CCF2|nr:MULTISPECIES: ABC transporter permease [unclassified Aurantimonas]MEC5291672.1 ABC transporter permease [Aurantimonas sp. C2-3-R2]MEC5381854.1 ABC transporter permease [Aurantimonas sp. C2-6-R+9]MEC5412756.1 ABC transporter permease [Aurantimonas sp. C2-4-R8]
MSAPALAAPAAAKPKRGVGGIVALGVWIAVAAGLVAYIASVWNPSLFTRFGPSYLSGLWITVSLVLISFVCGAIVSLPVALGRMATNPVARTLAFVFVYFFRGTPLIAQIFLVYYGFGQFRGAFEAVGLWWFFREAWYCAPFALSLNTAAYQAEILRGGIESVPKGQLEGARSLGLHRLVIFWKIVMPQAMIVALRPYANEIILMIKASAIVAIITVYDLFGETRQAYSRTFDFQTYVWAALLYLSIVEALRHATNFVERRLTRHLKR